MKRRFLFVPPRFGENVGGGAETLVASLAGRVAQSGADVQVFTTCAADNRTWENALPDGESVECGLRVRRFRVDPRNLDVWIPLQIRVADGLRLDVEEQLQWMENSVNSGEMYAEIARVADDYDAIFFAPYLFGTTFNGSLVRPDKSILIPCLHDESYAYTDVVASMFRQIKGCLFNASPEMVLARSLYGGSIKGGEVGMGFVPFSDEYINGLSPYFKEQFPYVLYVGRKETGKNAQILIDHFVKFKEADGSPDLKLVLVGGGSFSDLHRPGALERGDVVDLSHVSEIDKHRIIRHATVLCQPSTNESFSIVLMEAWLLGTPVLVNAACPVTRHHVLESGGGLFFRDEDDFCGIMSALLESEELRRELGQAGLRYVKTVYSWEAVLKRFENVTESLLGGA